MKPKLRWLIAFLLCITAAVVMASSGGGYGLSRWVVANGGSLSSNGSDLINGSIGQSVVGQSFANSYTLNSGLWGGYDDLHITATQTTAPVTETFTPEAPTATETPVLITETSTPDFVTVTNTPESVFVELLSNGGFEDRLIKPGQPDHWKGKGLAKDRLKCNTETIVFARNGLCAYRFVGSSTENARLSQTIDNTGNLVDGVILNTRLYYKTNNAKPRLKVKLIVFYADVTLTGRTKATLKTSSVVEYIPFDLPSYTIDARSPVISVKFQLQNRAMAGKIYVDDVSLNYRLPQ